ncbi:hypothetical protein PoB_003789200, partial [Plakobranchus ocellatus]
GSSPQHCSQDGEIDILNMLQRQLPQSEGANFAIHACGELSTASLVKPSPDIPPCRALEVLRSTLAAPRALKIKPPFLIQDSCKQGRHHSPSPQNTHTLEISFT